MTLETQAVLLKKYFSSRPEVEFAYLFGSGAKMLSGSLSDVDIAVYVDKIKIKGKYPYGYKAALASCLAGLIKSNSVDLVILNDAKPFLVFQVIKYGRLLQCANEAARVNFWIEALRRYDDAKRLMRIQQAFLKKRIERGESRA